MTNGDLGANEWLVDEMFEAYQKDPNSVDPAWIEYFMSKGLINKNVAGVSQQGSANNNVSAPVGNPIAGAPNGGVPPTPKAAAPKPVTPVAPVATPAAPAAPVQPAVQPVLNNRNKPEPTPADPQVRPAPVVAAPSSARVEPLRGVAGRVVQSMEASLSVPTATSVRAVPAKLLIDNRIVINNHLKRTRGGKVSFTHLIAFAMINAIKQMPEMNAFFTELDGKPAVGHPEHINLGIAIDLAKEDGSRQLLVPSIKGCEAMDFGQFWSAYEATVKKARNGALTVEDFAGTTVSLTNPGTIGTVHSVPRLVQGQGLILGVGAMDYPAEFQGASEETLTKLGISKVVTLTSTYDHRIIQGATSGDFLKRIHEMMLSDDFYDQIFSALRI
ncbi:MAG: 2-oxo acid dehydrogenase subunit E2, partial [Candidatus Nanopelagicaceae bacterium]